MVPQGVTSTSPHSFIIPIISLTHLSVQPISSAILLRLLAFLSLRMYIRQNASASEHPILRSLPSRGRMIIQNASDDADLTDWGAGRDFP